MTKTLKVLDKKTGNLLIQVICYEYKVYKVLKRQFKLTKGVNVVEE